MQKEIENLLWADCWIWQFPGWWFNAPWTVKKYIDEVFMASHGILFKHDGRVIDDPSKKYGTGGLCPEKVYMLSSTWNAPMEAFVTEGQFFEAKGIDGLLTQMHKANQFLGLSPLPSYICNDSIKNPEPEKYKSEYEKHLNTIF